MGRLFLHCVLCGRKQAEGLLSRMAWGHVEVNGGGMVSACPACKEAHSDWEDRVRSGSEGAG